MVNNAKVDKWVDNPIKPKKGLGIKVRGKVEGEKAGRLHKTATGRWVRVGRLIRKYYKV